MKNKTFKVAKWEIRRNLKNKTFVIGLFLTPILMIVFGFLGTLFGDSDHETLKSKVYVHDQLNVFEQLEATVDTLDLSLELEKTDMEEQNAHVLLDSEPDAAYISLNEEAIKNSKVTVIVGSEIDPTVMNQLQILAEPLKLIKLNQLGLTEEQMIAITQGIIFEEISVDEITPIDGVNPSEDLLKKAVPGIFAGIILLSITFTGMMIFQSASQEKKDKIAEIILSSVTPTELMQGKIIGYFVLGLIQMIVLLIFVVPFAITMIDIPILDYLFVPELLLFIFIAILGYLLFSSIFVGIGATMSDVSTAGNFQGIVLMIPFLPFFFIGGIISNPEGLLAQVLSYIPFTSPATLILRLSMLQEWPLVDIIVGIAILIISVWVFMKLAGKIFKVGILLYGKNATPGEIWKWIRS